MEGFLAGAVPPPGLYVLEYATAYSADSLRDNQGARVPLPTFGLDVRAAATRIIWSTPQPLLGGNLVAHTILPLLDLKVDVPGASQHRSGLGDITVGAGIAWHHSTKWHSVAALDFVLPTGGYDKNDAANLGRNYASIQPLYAMSYINPQGFNGDFMGTLSVNRKNDATGYRSGDEFILDYALGWSVGGGFTLGVGGYWYRQFSDDKLSGATVVGARGRSFAIGPALRFDNGKGWFITAKWQRESEVSNRPEGSAFWIKSNIPF